MVRLFVSAVALDLVSAQHAGSQVTEKHLPVQATYCSESIGGCLPEDTTIVLDQNWRWVHNVDGYTNCFDNDEWVPSFCPDPETCSENCALEGNDAAALESNYGIEVTDGGVQEKFEAGNNVGSRVYLMDSDSTYKMFYLKNKEFTFDVELSTLPCGINAALYFVEMEADGGLSSSAGKNSAGAKYGTGYCDAQCPGDVKFINGLGNVNLDDPLRVCCAELDIWEANKIATAYTPHPCSCEGPTLCDGDACGTTVDPAGCDFNSYREGVKDFYGPGSDFDVDSTKPVTVVTQFLTHDGTDDGDLAEIRRFYVQDGKKIPNSQSTLGHDSLTDDSCAAQKDLWGEDNQFADNGGMKGMGDAMGRGMVLVMSIWDDNKAHMLWLDSIYPVNATGPGAERGPCATDSGDPADVRPANPDAYVKWTNIKYGDIGATYPPLPPAPTPPPPPPPPTPTPLPPAPTPPAPTPPAPSPPGTGRCCFNAPTSCAAVDFTTCASDGFCGEPDHCANNCGGLWCTGASVV